MDELAFPIFAGGLSNRGMTLRDYFAAKAMQGMIAAPYLNDKHGFDVAGKLSDGLSYTDGWRGRIAVASYAMADAMMEARKGNK